MSLPAPVVCETSPDCCIGAPIFYGQGRTYLNAQTGFLLTCPPGFSCDAGAYPHNIIVPGGSIPFTPPTGSNPLRITCCDGVILASYLPIGFTQAQFDAAAQSLVNQAAEHLAGCMAADYNRANARFRPPRATCTITSGAQLPTATISVPYSHQLTHSGGTPPLAWALTAGFLPPGLTLSASGIVSGTPTSVPGSNLFTARLTTANAICSKQFNISTQGICSGATDWENPGACRIRVQNFNVADFTPGGVCDVSIIATWDGTLPVFDGSTPGQPIYKCAGFDSPLKFIWAFYVPGLFGTGRWFLEIHDPVFPGPLLYQARSPGTDNSDPDPIAVWDKVGGCCTGPLTVTFESYIP